MKKWRSTNPINFLLKVNHKRPPDARWLSSFCFLIYQTESISDIDKVMIKETIFVYFISIKVYWIIINESLYLAEKVSDMAVKIIEK